MTGPMSTGAAPVKRAPVPTWLVTGSRATEREAAIAARLETGVSCVAILEGLADGGSALAFDDPIPYDPAPQVLRIAPGCLHCSGNLILRVTLNRVLRHPPARLYISLASAEHLELLRSWLSEAPYGDLLDLQSDIAA
ncbi:GTPase [Duganella sp. BJB488]|uniref:GTPase n=2 Tax=Duganella TaxID=75654 RepID=UPI000E350190|nr:GTPase [Duganella sp. BJB489]RFP25179.1 GTPase [Duganella sp. BJB488]RFP33745.1 GTPase [Duganella sp. BJB480]